YVKEIGAAAEVALAPQCGLASGFICVLGADMATRFDAVKTIKMRVGALPLCPTNVLRYNVTWSVDGLINEYCNPCEMVFDGKPMLAPALDGVESVMIDGVAYEAFNTSGGLGTLAETLAGQVRDMSYKTLRYPGHVEIMKLLLHGLELSHDKETMRRILDRAAPFTRKDVVVIFVTGVGERGGRMEEDSIVLRYDGKPELGAIQLTTAAGCVAMVELFLAGKLPAKGFVRQEDASLSDFLSTRAGARLAKEARNSETNDISEKLAAKRAA
ncbi:MAG: saccharopine dehydrogenase family protein, partial [Methylocystis sp.]|nr:saccharopine dehydrogenase family protein [Methylocystis sp.]